MLCPCHPERKGLKTHQALLAQHANPPTTRGTWLLSSTPSSTSQPRGRDLVCRVAQWAGQPCQLVPTVMRLHLHHQTGSPSLARTRVIDTSLPCAQRQQVGKPELSQSATTSGRRALASCWDRRDPAGVGPPHSDPQHESAAPRWPAAHTVPRGSPLSGLQGPNGYALSPHPRLLQALCSFSATPARVSPNLPEPQASIPVPTPALGSQCSPSQVSDGCLVLPHGSGSQETDRVQPGAKSDLGDTGPTGGSQAAGPGAARSPPSSRTGGHGSLRDTLGPALGLPPFPPQLHTCGRAGSRPRATGRVPNLEGTWEQHSSPEAQREPQPGRGLGVQPHTSPARPKDPSPPGTSPPSLALPVPWTLL